MKCITLAAVLIALAIPWGRGLQAQPVYKCGNSYSQQPCAGGAMVPVEDGRSAAQKSQTSEAAKRDAKAADALEKERLTLEGKAAPAHLPASQAQDRATAPRTLAGKPKKPEVFSAVVPKKAGDKVASKKKKKKKQAS